ncbi:MAG TPA: lytic transglycosylase domain-containing protein [Actinoplanes sp.]
MDRLWSRVGARTLAVALLIGGIAGGVHLGQHRDEQQQGAQAQLAMDVDAADLQMLKARQNEHAAARAQQREAESDAAVKAALEAKSAAGKASSLRRAVADHKAAVARAKTETNTGTVPYNGPIPGSCKEFVGNRATGCALMLDDGFGIDQFPCLNKLWNKESGWNAHAENKGSGAYGIPQALPGSKMGTVASDWKTNPATQIKWGLGYIKGRYNSPCGAWQHSEDTGSY